MEFGTWNTDGARALFRVPSSFSRSRTTKKARPIGRALRLAVPPWLSPEATARCGARLSLPEQTIKPGANIHRLEGSLGSLVRGVAAYAPASANGGFRPSLLGARTQNLEPFGVRWSWVLGSWFSLRFGRRLGRDFRAAAPCPLAPCGTRWPGPRALLVSVNAFVLYSVV